MSNTGSTLNEYQQRRLLITCRYIDELLSNIERILHVSVVTVPFPKYIPDVLPAQQKAIHDYAGRIRTRLVEILECQRIDRGNPTIPATHAIHSDLTFIDIAIAELRPRHMRGYGGVSHEAERDLNEIVADLEELVKGLDVIVTDGHSHSTKGK